MPTTTPGTHRPRRLHEARWCKNGSESHSWRPWTTATQPDRQDLNRDWQVSSHLTSQWQPPPRTNVFPGEPCKLADRLHGASRDDLKFAEVLHGDLLPYGRIKFAGFDNSFNKSVWSVFKKDFATYYFLEMSLNPFTGVRHIIRPFFGPRNLRSLLPDRFGPGVLKTLSNTILWRAIRKISSPFLFYMHLIRVIQKGQH